MSRAMAKAVMDQVRAEMSARRITQAEVARRTGLHRPIVARLLSCRDHTPSLESMCRLATALDMRLVLRLEPIAAETAP